MRDINLMPEELKDFISKEETKKIRLPIKAGIIAGVILVLMVVSFLIPKMIVGTLSLRVQTLENKLKDKDYTDVQSINQQIQAEAGKIAVKNSVIGQIEAEAYPVSGILNTLTNTLPEGCNLSTVEFSEKSLNISGMTEQLMDAAELMVNMDRLDYIDSNNSSENISIDNTNPALKYKFKLNFAVGRKDGK